MKKLVAILLAAAMLSVCVACGGNNSADSNTNTPQENTTQSDAAGNESAENTPTMEVKKRDTLVLGINAGPVNLDPYLLNQGCANYVCNIIYDTLVRDDGKGYVNPNLATEWTISDDGLEYVFTIRDDVYFQTGTYQDGRKMTTEDVAWCLNRCKDNYTGYMAMLDNAEAIDDTHVKCTLEYATPLFILNLWQNLTAIVPPEEVEGWGDDFNNHIVGTGPFMLESHDPDSETVMVKNPNYWGPEPSVEKVILKVIPDVSQRAYALLSGEVDFACNISGEAIDLVEADDSVQMLPFELNMYSGIGMNLNDEILGNADVRKAIIMATDREALYSGTYLREAEASPADIIVPTNSEYYSDDLLDYIPDYDPAAAKDLLSSAGYPNGLALTLYLTDSETGMRAATIFQALMKANLNVDVNISVQQAAAMNEMLCNGTAQMWFTSQSYTNDPSGYYGYAFGSDHLNSNYNPWKYSNAEVDALLKEGEAETDPAKRLEIYNKIADIVFPENVGLWFAKTNYPHAGSVDLKGIDLQGAAIPIFFDQYHDCWIEEN